MTTERGERRDARGCKEAGGKNEKKMEKGEEKGNERKS